MDDPTHRTWEEAEDAGGAWTRERPDGERRFPVGLIGWTLACRLGGVVRRWRRCCGRFGLLDWLLQHKLCVYFNEAAEDGITVVLLDVYHDLWCYIQAVVGLFVWSVT